MDRDVVAAMNIAYRGRSRFERSQGAAGEAVRGNPTTTVILRVDVVKLTCRRKPQANRTDYKGLKNRRVI